VPPAPTDSPAATAATERAQYLAFARTWAAAARLSPLSPEKLERRVIRYFRHLVLRLEPAVVLEIGAHGAQFSRWAARHLRDARVTAFEANPYVHAKFEETLAGTRVDYRHLAVGPVTGEIQLIVPTEVRGQQRDLTSRMASLGVHTKASGQVEVTVPSVRLADFLSLGTEERMVAWIDVEGANGPVLESSAEVLGRLDAAYIEVELEETWEGQWLDTDVAVFLQRHGLVPVARDVKRPHQYNVVFVRDSLLVDEATTRDAAALLWGKDAGVDAD
jgi:FkbM family methyltransferase